MSNSKGETVTLQISSEMASRIREDLAAGLYQNVSDWLFAAALEKLGRKQRLLDQHVANNPEFVERLRQASMVEANEFQAEDMLKRIGHLPQ